MTAATATGGRTEPSLATTILADLDSGAGAPPSRTPPPRAGGAPTPRSRPRSSPASATGRPSTGISTASCASAIASASRPRRSSPGRRPTRPAGGPSVAHRPRRHLASGPASTSARAS